MGVASGRGPIASLRERKKADTRTRLSAAAVELLVAEGVEGATVSAIAGRAGVSTRTFHNYFAHREDAFVHFLREQIAEFVRQVDQADADLTPVDIFRTMFRELGENVTSLGDQMGEASGQVADWLRGRGGLGGRRGDDEDQIGRAHV